MLSVGITLLEACYISHDWIREFSDFAQGLFAAMPLGTIFFKD